LFIISRWLVVSFFSIFGALGLAMSDASFFFVAVVFFLSSVCMRLDRIPSAGSREATVVVVLVVAGNDDLSCVFFFLSL
jgi:hypothetical protein